MDRFLLHLALQLGFSELDLGLFLCHLSVLLLSVPIDSLSLIDASETGVLGHWEHSVMVIKGFCGYWW